MKPLTVPSAYRDTMSPIWRKLEAESDILQLVPRLRQRQKAQVHQVETFSRRLGAPSLTQKQEGSHMQPGWKRANRVFNMSGPSQEPPQEPGRDSSWLHFSPGSSAIWTRSPPTAGCERACSACNCLCVWVCVRGRARPRRQTSAIQEKKKEKKKKPGSR